MKEVVIVSVARTALGSFQGSLSGFSATELGGSVMKEAVKRAGIVESDVDEVIMGNVLPHGLGQNPARQASMKAGIPHESGAITVNKVCGSGLKAVMLAAQAIICNDADVVVAGGMESMSQAPYFIKKARTGHRMGHGELTDAMIHDGLWDINNDYHMGYTAELVANKFKVSREEMDTYTLQSYDRALKAQKAGLFQKEIVEIEIPQRRKAPIPFSSDEILRPTSLEDLAKLRPAFIRKTGSVTAGNSSKISDGAAALVITSREFAEKKGLKILATIKTQASAGIEPEDVLVAPLRAIPKILKKAKLTIEDIDLFEVNEAFASSTIAVQKELGIPNEKLNVLGGSIALGHPIGASGARVLITLLTALEEKKKKRGLVTLCLGGGEAVALIVEKEG